MPYVIVVVYYCVLLAFSPVAMAPGVEQVIEQERNLPGRELFMRDSQGEIVKWSDIKDGGRVEHYNLR